MPGKSGRKLPKVQLEGSALSCVFRIRLAAARRGFICGSRGFREDRGWGVLRGPLLAHF